MHTKVASNIMGKVSNQTYPKILCNAYCQISMTFGSTLLCHLVTTPKQSGPEYWRLVALSSLVRRGLLEWCLWWSELPVSVTREWWDSARWHPYSSNWIVPPWYMCCFYTYVEASVNKINTGALFFRPGIYHSRCTLIVTVCYHWGQSPLWILRCTS